VRSPKLTEHQVLMMLELCLDAGERCDERIAAARARGEYSTAAYEVQLKEQYENMKTRLLDEMRYSGATTQDLHAMLQRIGRSVEKFSGPGDAAETASRGGDPPAIP
jgi:hypothetical protein